MNNFFPGSKADNSSFNPNTNVNRGCDNNNNNNNNSNPNRGCDAGVLKSDTLPGADNYPMGGSGIYVPRILSEFVIQVDTEAKIRLNELAYEIKRNEKQVFLTQCRYIPPTGKVFIEGYIRMNIEYAAKTCARDRAISGSIKDTTVHVPFQTYTKVNFNGNYPNIESNPPQTVTRYYDKKAMGKNIHEADRSNIEFFNEPVYCELAWTAIFDAEINDKGHRIEGFRNEYEFQEFTDKSVVYIAMRLLQKQMLPWTPIPGPGPGPGPCGGNCCHNQNFSHNDFVGNSLSSDSDWPMALNGFIKPN